MKYKIGDKLIMTNKKFNYGKSNWTMDKEYTICQILSYHSSNIIEYGIIRDDGFVGLWWENEIDDHFKSLKKIRKEKLDKIICQLVCV